MTRATFWEWFNRVQAEAVETEDGKAFAANGFRVQHNGGGTTAWERPIPGCDWFLRVTDSEGFGHSLDPELEPADSWLVAAYEGEGEAVTDCYPARTVAEALAVAKEIEAALLAEAE